MTRGLASGEVGGAARAALEIEESLRVFVETELKAFTKRVIDALDDMSARGAFQGEPWSGCAFRTAWEELCYAEQGQPDHVRHVPFEDTGLEDAISDALSNAGDALSDHVASLLGAVAVRETSRFMGGGSDPMEPDVALAMVVRERVSRLARDRPLDHLGPGRSSIIRDREPCAASKAWHSLACDVRDKLFRQNCDALISDHEDEIEVFSDEIAKLFLNPLLLKINNDPETWAHDEVICEVVRALMEEDVLPFLRAWRKSVADDFDWGAVPRQTGEDAR